MGSYTIEIKKNNPAIKKALKALLKNPEKELVFFNAPFDLVQLLKGLYPEVFFAGQPLETASKNYVSGYVWDVAILLRVLHSGYERNSLADWSRRILGLSLPKTLQTGFTLNMELQPSHLDYMHRDVITTAKLFFHIFRENYYWVNTFSSGKSKIYVVTNYLRYEEPLILEAVDVCFRGFVFDKDAYEKAKALAESKKAGLNNELKQCSGEEFTTVSSEKLDVLMKNTNNLGIPAKVLKSYPRTNGGKLTTSTKLLLPFISQHNLNKNKAFMTFYAL